MSLWPALAAVACFAVSGAPGVLGRRRGGVAEVAAAALMVAGAALGLAAVVAAFRSAEPARLARGWLPPWGAFAVELDPLGAVFLAAICVVPALGSVYGLGYWRQARHPRGAARLRFFYGLMTAAMAVVVLARDGVLFLIAWEVMALSAFFLVTAEDHDPAARAAGWVYLVAAHAGTFCLAAMFATIRRATGAFDVAPAGLADPHAANAVFALALAGFGFKAGLMPLHVWLPGAHANAPSHVSAVLSGVMLKMGVYGIVRVVAALPVPPAWWGGLLLGVGVVSGLAGIAFAIGQRDLKRALAYSSIENVGVIAIGLGVALLGRAHHRADVVLLGLGGALLHVWNHSLFKALLFFNAGAIIHAAGTRDVNRLGGLAKRMPRSAALFLVAAVAICALPPLNGFVSELLIYIGSARMSGLGATGAAWPAASVAIPALAMIGALAVACFVGLFGGVYLGEPRHGADRAHEPGPAMLAPMAILAGGCLAVGLAPALVLPWVNRAAGVWAGTAGSLAEAAPVGWVTVGGLAVVALAAGIFVLCRAVASCRGVAAAGTWDCGYARPTARMQYTNGSFGHTLGDVFGWLTRPRHRRPRLKAPFPPAGECSTERPDLVLDRAVIPLFRVVGRFAPWVRLLQQGRTQIYVLYFLAAVLGLFFWGGCA